MIFVLAVVEKSFQNVAEVDNMIEPYTLYKINNIKMFSFGLSAIFFTIIFFCSLLLSSSVGVASSLVVGTLCFVIALNLVYMIMTIHYCQKYCSYIYEYFRFIDNYIGDSIRVINCMLRRIDNHSNVK